MMSESIPYSQRYKHVEIEGKAVEDSYTIHIDGEPFTMKEVMTSIRFYVSHKERAAQRVKNKRQKLKNLKNKENM